jgi:hypothetical protein
VHRRSITLHAACGVAASVLGATALALGSAGPDAAAPVEQFTSDTAGIHADAATVPAGNGQLNPGGGSSFARLPISTSSEWSSRTGDGQVTVIYDPTTDTCPSGGEVIPAAPVAAAPRFTG